jgi:hypothetical protein
LTATDLIFTTMWPLSQGELLGKQETFLDVVSADPAAGRPRGVGDHSY